MKIISNILICILIVFIIFAFIFTIIDSTNYNSYKTTTKNLAFKWECNYGDATFEQFLELAKEHNVYDFDIKIANINSICVSTEETILSHQVIKFGSKMMLFNKKDYRKYKKWYEEFMEEKTNNYNENLWRE